MTKIHTTQEWDGTGVLLVHFNGQFNYSYDIETHTLAKILLNTKSQNKHLTFVLLS